MLRGVLIAAAMVVLVAGHGMLLIPTPRNARDRDLDLFANGSWPSTTDGCDCANPSGGCDAFAARRSGSLSDLNAAVVYLCPRDGRERCGRRCARRYDEARQGAREDMTQGVGQGAREGVGESVMRREKTL